LFAFCFPEKFNQPLHFPSAAFFQTRVQIPRRPLRITVKTILFFVEVPLVLVKKINI